MKKIFFIFLLFANCAYSQSIGTSVFSWNPPTQRENGETLNQVDIAGYVVAVRKEGDTNFIEAKVDPQLPEFPITAAFGNYEAKVKCWDKNGLHSGWSSIKKFTIKSVPKKPLYPSVRVI